jgi:signal transduction histidine kinase
VVPAGHERIAIEYAGLSLAAPQKVRYRYQLEGFDRGWVQAGSERTAFYTNVPPGRYRFAVAASNTEGVWSAVPAEIELQVRPRFFQTGWFYALVAAGLILLGYLLYRLRVRYVEARLNGVMAERGRIAREIHDTLAQGYVGISVQLEIASQLLGHSPAAAREQLEETKALVRSGLEEARSSIWELRSEAEGAESLPARLTALANRRQRNGKPQMTLEVRGSYRALPRKIEDEMFRVAQEAVENALRHADANRIGISLSYDAKHVELRVSDDGRGFSGDVASFAARGHFGLKGMRERAAAIDGVLEVDSEQGGGTAVILRIKAQSRAEKGNQA